MVSPSVRLDSLVDESDDPRFDSESKPSRVGTSYSCKLVTRLDYIPERSVLTRQKYPRIEESLPMKQVTTTKRNQLFSPRPEYSRPLATGYLHKIGWYYIFHMMKIYRQRIALVL